MAKLNILEQIEKRTGTADIKLEIKKIPISQIETKQNIRNENINIEELKNSIKATGLLQPITIYKDNEKYICIIGHRRLLAYKELYKENQDRFHSIPAIITDDKNIITRQIIENLQRVDLTAYELYQALKQLKKQRLKYKQIADIIGKSEGYIKNLFSAIKEIDTDYKNIELLKSDIISLSDFKTVKPIKDKKQKQELLNKKAENKITQKELQNEVKKYTKTIKAGKDKSIDKTNDYELLQLKYKRLKKDINSLISDFKNRKLDNNNKNLNSFIKEIKAIIKYIDEL